MWDKDKRHLLEEIRVLRSRNARLERLSSEMPGPRDARLIPHADPGESIGVIASGPDIAEHRQAQEELEDSIERFRMVMDSLDALVYVSDMDTHEVLFANKYAREVSCHEI